MKRHMIKVIPSALLVVLSVMVSVSARSFNYSNIYPTYLNGDKNFVLVDGHMGTAWYIDKTSLVNESYNPPIYKLAINVLTVQGADRGNTAFSVDTKHFSYNYSLRQMYVLNKDGNWRYIPANGASYQTRPVLPAGEAAFYLAYNMRFNGDGDSLYNSLK